MSELPDLLIISDTNFYREGDKVAVFEATLREIEELTAIFDTITWIGFIFDEPNPGNARVPKTDKIKLVSLPAAGGHTIASKFGLLAKFFGYVRVINQYANKHQYIHTRGPSVPAFIGILRSFYDKKRKYWHKFAGNWNQQNPPKSYGIQRSLLKKAGHTFVAVNGRWENQPPQVNFFENPCFNESELVDAREARDNKDYNGPITCCFVGRIEEPKGVGRLLDALELIEHPIEKFYFVGGGEALPEFKERAQKVNANIEFTGKISRTQLNEIYRKSQIFCLPSSASEGFPKVISEAASYGCVPVVSSVSSIGQYIKTGDNGVLLNDVSPAKIAEGFTILLADRNKLRELAFNFDKTLEIFTYEYYNKRINEGFVNE